MRSRQNLPRFIFTPGSWLLLLAGSIFLTGCGGPTLYNVSGTVNFKGKPIPVGKIYFQPDGKKQNTGPSGYADIVDGRFNTASGGQGVMGGPMVIRIDGSDGKKALFITHEENRDIPTENSTQDFNVPAEAAAGLPKDQGPPP